MKIAGGGTPGVGNVFVLFGQRDYDVFSRILAEIRKP